MIRYFWWGDEDGQRKVYWMAWDRLLMPKCLGYRVQGYVPLQSSLASTASLASDPIP
jgi:hypothetical protein